MTRNKPMESDDSHVFDQTNGLVDLGADESLRSDATDGTSAPDRNRTLDGLAMISVKTH